MGKIVLYVTQNQQLERTQYNLYFVRLICKRIDEVDENIKLCPIRVEMFQKLTNHGRDDISRTQLVHSMNKKLIRLRNLCFLKFHASKIYPILLDKNQQYEKQWDIK